MSPDSRQSPGPDKRLTTEQVRRSLLPTEATEARSKIA